MHPIKNTYYQYSPRLFVHLMVTLLGVILALRVTPFASYAVGGLVVYTATQKRVEVTFFVLMLLISLSIMNSVFFEKGFHFYLATRVSILVVALAMTFKAGFVRGAWFLSPFAWLFAYMGYIMLTSLGGWCPIISELKAVLFLAFMLALVQSVSVAVQSGVDASMIRAAMLVVSCFYIVGSVASIPFPSIGRSMVILQALGYGEFIDMTELSGLFNGVTWHSQTLGPTIAMLNAFLLSDYLCNFKKRDLLYWLLLALVPVLVYMTSSRTALFAYLISLLSSVFFFLQERRISSSKKSNVLVNFLLALVVGAGFLFLRPSGLERAEMFLRKTDDLEKIQSGETITESMTKSRMGLVESGMLNFRESPLIGNGFQVSKEMRDVDITKTGLILSAPIEKGVLPVMVLEEGGIIGALLFMSFLLSLYVNYRKMQFTCFLSTFTVFLGLNSGEAAFFSTSGGGGILWMICFCALLMDVHRRRSMLVHQQEQLKWQRFAQSRSL